MEKKITKRGDLVKEIRKEMDLTQIEFAKEMKVNQGSVSAWENDTYPFSDDRLFKLKFIFEKRTGKLELSRELFTPFIENIVGVI